jgi:hypothetical protein
VIKKLHCVFAAMLLAGCASTVNMPLGTSQADQIRGRSLAVVTHEKPSFSAATATKAMFGAFGAMTMISEGDEIVRANEVQDPSVYIAEAIAGALAQRYDLATSAETSIANTDDVDALSEQYAASDLILLTMTRGWGFIYFPTDWDNYRVGLNVTMQLIDRDQRTVLAAADCAYQPEYADSDQASSHDDLLSNDAAGLKAELQEGADYCLKKFLSETFG